MDNIIYEALVKYYHALELLGYISKKDSYKLLVLLFYRDFVFNDYRGLLTKEDYLQIEKALNCLYGTSCLIPYPDYLKMGKLHLGAITEIAQRIKNLEDTNVVKLIRTTDSTSDIDSDIQIVEEE